MAVYLPNQPHRAVIGGHRFAPLSPWALLLYIMPALGLISIIITWRIGAKHYHLLHYGQPVEAQPVNQTATNTRVNNQRVYKYILAFDWPGEAVQMVLKTSQMTVGGTVLLLVEPARPSYWIWAECPPQSLTMSQDHVGHRWSAYPRLIGWVGFQGRFSWLSCGPCSALFSPRGNRWLERQMLVRLVEPCTDGLGCRQSACNIATFGRSCCFLVVCQQQLAERYALRSDHAPIYW